MPIPTPREKESPDAFMHRCMGDSVMMKEFPEQKQRVAVCMTSWKNSKKKAKSEKKDDALIAQRKEQ